MTVVVLQLPPVKRKTETRLLERPMRWGDISMLG